MPRWIDVEVGGIELRLLAERGVFWHSEQTLFVADTHFGKEATFRRHGIPVPRGSTDSTLSVISRMISSTGARQLVILGDMFHARSSLSTDVRDSLDSFFDEQTGVDFTLVRGNHDLRVGPLPTSWPISIVEPVACIGRLAMGHHPDKVPPHADALLCGHIHPAVHVASATDSLGSLPCFWKMNGTCLVLPAIGQFTGRHSVRPNRGDQVWFIAEEEIFAREESKNLSTIR